MKAEKFTQSTETLNEGLNNSMKWFQESTNLFLEAQSKQMKFVSDLYSSSFNAAFSNFGSFNNLNSSFHGTEKMGELMKQNIEQVSKMTEANTKALLELGEQFNNTFFQKNSMDQLMEIYNKQMAVVMA